MRIHKNGRARTFLHAHGVAGTIGVDGDDLRAARQLRDDLRTAVDAADRMAAVAALLEGVHVVVRLRPGPVLCGSMRAGRDRPVCRRRRWCASGGGRGGGTVRAL